MDGQGDRETGRQTDRRSYGWMDREIERQGGRQTVGQMDGWTGR